MEKADPIELRIYRGANGASRSTKTKATTTITKREYTRRFRFHGMKPARTLTIGKRAGNFHGMLKKRTFRIVWVSPDHGTGVASTPLPDMELTYGGGALVVSAPQH